jgi:hypothetical protein
LENRNKVKRLLAFGWGNARIASALGISEPTLRKHYLSELKRRSMARDALVAKQLDQLWAQCEAGNVGAMKEFQRRLEANDRMGLTDDLRKGDLASGKREQQGRDTVEPQPIPEGKKEMARAAARNLIGGDPDLLPAAKQRLI